MLQAEYIAQPLQCQSGQMKILKLPGTIQGSGVEDDMVMDMCPVGMSRYDESIFALGEAHCQFVAHLVGLLGGDLTGLERLPDLIGDHIIFLSAPCGKFVLPLGQHKFLVCGQWAALVATDQLSPVRFVRILRVVRAAFQAGRNRLAFVFVQRNQTCCSQSDHLPAKRKCRTVAAF